MVEQNAGHGRAVTEPVPAAPVVPSAGTGGGVRRGRGTGVAAVLLSAALLSSSYTLTEVALRDVPPLTIGLLRFTAAAALLAVWVHLVRGYPAPDRADRTRLALGGLLGITLYFAVENVGVELATATDAALLVGAYPALTALLELIVHRQRTSAGGLAGIGLSVAGVCLVVGFTPDGGTERWAGDVLLVLSGVVWAFYNFVTRDVGSRCPADQVLYYQARTGALAFLPLALLEWGSWREFAAPVTTVASLAALTLLCSIAGLGLYAKGLQHLRSSTAVNLLNLVPVFGLIIPVVALDEDVTAFQVLGGLVVIIGVTVTTRGDGRS
ncbi:DMT family transporter [Streptomyces sp. MS19]|uniref:DMT family transporter n=1 Tax=Streptomyces sp. MS19 TaxID=3385972 RepID=UPI0039A31CAA